MKIHTTQNLSGVAQQQILSTNSVSLSELRFNQKDINDANYGRDLYFSNSVAFGMIKKKPNPKDLRFIIKQTRNNLKVGDIKEKASPEVKKDDKLLNSKGFDTMLKLAENEPVIQAAMAALICIGLRPLTIMALPNKKGKQDNMYAASHSISSGIMGIISTLIIAQPFKMGAKYTKDVMLKDLKEDALQRLFPNLDMNSIYEDSSKKVRKAVSEWRFIDGNKFLPEFKDVAKIPMLKPLNEISAQTYKQFGADVDWAAYKGKSFNEVYTRDGRPLLEALDWTKVGIIVERDGSKDARILIRDLDKDFLTQVIEDAESTSIWKKLDLNSVYKDGKVQDYRLWKDLDGQKWKLDLDTAYISSPYDTADYIPRISGKIREVCNGKIKYSAYMKNGENGNLGTEITKELDQTNKRNEVHSQLLTWLPDILTRPLVATATIALIPLALAKVFHIEKSNKTPNTKELENQISDNTAEKADSTDKQKETVTFKGNSENDDGNENISFKGKNNNKKSSFFERFIAKPLSKAYGKPLYESERALNLAGKLMKIPGKMSTHMATLGALLTSAVYIQQTRKKKELDADRRRTLAINQALCFVIPTIGAYLVDNALKDWIKKKEYRFSGLQEQKIAIAKLENRMDDVNALETGLGKKLNGVRILAGLATFTLIYRYIAPVLITPAANKIGEHFNERKKAKAIAAAETKPMTVKMTPDNISDKAAKTIAMNENLAEQTVEHSAA